MGLTYQRKIYSATFIIFKSFMAHIEVESSYKIKILRSNRGGEYTSNEFQDYYKKNGIKQQFTTAYTPRQNGIAKRKNWTILDMTRTVLKEKCFPKYFWAEAMACIDYLVNRCPSQNMTP